VPIEQAEGKSNLKVHKDHKVNREKSGFRDLQESRHHDLLMGINRHSHYSFDFGCSRPQTHASIEQNSTARRVCLSREVDKLSIPGVGKHWQSWLTPWLA